MSKGSFSSVLLLLCVLVSSSLVVDCLRHARHKGALHDGLFYRGMLEETAPEDGPQPQWFDQRVDHFDPLNSGTWRQKYFVNDTFWTTGGPIFYLLGGEGPIAPSDVLGHFVLNNYAQTFGALIVSVEHRFYGESQPFADLSTPNLKYLTSEQALADYAAVRQHIVEQYECPNNKWIVFGGSYSGALSAWFRLKYPNLVAGSIATSAPVFAQEEFAEYFQVVSDSVGPSCEARLIQANNVISQMLKSEQGRNELQGIFNTCTPIETDPKNLAMFWEAISGGISDIVQYSNDNNKYIPFNVATMCNILESGGPSSLAALKALADFNTMFNNFSNQQCTEVSYTDYVTQLRNIDPTNSNAAARTWTWQTCIEFGYFQTSTGSNQPFPNAITLDWFVDMCNDIFGMPLSPDVNWTNTYYGGRDVEGSNIVFPNGSVDPWHKLGILDTINPSLPAYYMQGTAHCADLYPPRATDLPTLTNTRMHEQKLIAQWIAQ